MTDHNWEESGKHPPLGTILLHLDGDLEEAVSAALAQHFSDCWECRALRDKVGRGIHAFMEYRQDVLLPSIPPSSPQRHAFRLQSSQVLGNVRLKSMPASLLASLRAFVRTFSATPRVVAGITAALSAAALIFLAAIPVTHPTVLTATELIQRARASANHEVALKSAGTRKSAKKVVYQKIQLSSGNRTIEREVVLGETGAPEEVAPPDADWARLLAATPIDWKDPLGVDRYERWREEGGRGKDTISEAEGVATLTTVPTAQSLVESASLTVREADWHPIAKHVSLLRQTAAGVREIDVKEIEFGVREVPEPEIIASLGKPPAHLTETPDAPVPDVPSISAIDEAEIHLREILHGLGADVRESPEIVRDGSVIHFRAYTETLERKQELLASVQGVPYVVADIFYAEALPAAGVSPGISMDPSANLQPPHMQTYSTLPPLIKPLQDFLGGLDTANNYLHSVRDSYREALTSASALQRLSARYSDAQWRQLQPELRSRVDRLASDYIDSVQRRSGIYLKQVSIGLDEMLSRSKLSPEAGPQSNASCRAWRTDSTSVVDELRRLETAFQELFVVEKTDQPVSLSSETLLLESARLRTRYTRDIEQFCPLEIGK